VLCEKPIALTAAEAETLKTAPKGVLIAEAFMVRAHPQWIKARDLAKSGKLGRLVAVQSLFTYHNVDPDNVRNMADIGGGAAYDIGCYPIVVARYVFGAEPLRVAALVDRDPKFRTDRTTSAVVDFGKGRHLTFTVSTQATPYQRVHILGTEGRVEVEIPFNAPQGGAMNIYLDNGRKFADASAKKITLPKADQYQLLAEVFNRAAAAARIFREIWNSASRTRSRRPRASSTRIFRSENASRCLPPAIGCSGSPRGRRQGGGSRRSGCRSARFPAWCAPLAACPNSPPTMRSGLARADREGLPAYVECLESLVPYYSRFGFAPTGRIAMPEGARPDPARGSNRLEVGGDRRAVLRRQHRHVLHHVRHLPAGRIEVRREARFQEGDDVGLGPAADSVGVRRDVGDRTPGLPASVRRRTLGSSRARRRSRAACGIRRSGRGRARDRRRGSRRRWPPGPAAACGCRHA
jgi:hypothetical protein